MEIVECYFLVFMVMMCYRGKFIKIVYLDVIIYFFDEGKVVEEKWKKWY